MFKGLSGLKKVVTGGFHAVAENSSALAEQVTNDPRLSRDQLKESIKKKVQGGFATVVDAGETVYTNADAATTKEKAAEVAHKVKHYGAFGEDYLGYSDPTKDLRKAVKQKEKAAKKARKEKKKLTGKKGEDLFDPANLAKYKKELEEKRRLQEEAAAATADKSERSDDDDEDEDREVRPSTLGFEDVSPGQEGAGSSAVTPTRNKQNKEDSDDWRLFQSLASGVDSAIAKTKDELADLKQDSFYLQKQREKEEHEKAEEQVRLKGKKWVNLDSAGFEDHEGEVRLTKEQDGVHVVPLQVDEDQVVPGEEAQEDQVQEEEEPQTKVPLFFKEPSIEIPDVDDDLFNTDLVDAVTSGQIKLAVIPDDDPLVDDEDDPFNTSIAATVVAKQKEEELKKQRAAQRAVINLSATADLLSGKKSTDLANSSIDQSLRAKRRRANRINLIADDATAVTALEDIDGAKVEKEEGKATGAGVDILIDEVEGGDQTASEQLLACTPSPSPVPQTGASSATGETGNAVDLSEFETVGHSREGVALTSNVAILSGEFAAPAAPVEEDDFDAAFDSIAKASVTKSKLDDLERQFENDDVDIFDTAAADRVLGYVSLTSRVDEDQSTVIVVDNYDDPFDTSAFDHITGQVETELEFESLAQRKDAPVRSSDAEPESTDAFSASVFGGEVNAGGDDWAAFAEKPSRPPPPKPRAPSSYVDRRGVPPAPGSCTLDPSKNPSVVVKAPSTESIKSWNCSVADNLLLKSQRQALQEEADEYDPFDTAKFEEEEKEDIEDPFDTSHVKEDEEEEQQQQEQKEERKSPRGLLEDGAEDSDHDAVLKPVCKDLTNPESDPFDTGFANEVLPDHGDPFDTSWEKNLPGKAEVHALEEEFLEDDLDAAFNTSKVISTGGVAEVKEEEEEDGEDPFDTSVVEKVIAVRKVSKKRSEVSVEDDDFDPTATFAQSRNRQQTIDEETKKTVAVKEDDIDDDDFDPRA